MLCTCAHTAISTVQMHKRADTDFVHDFFFMAHTKGTHVLIITSEDFHGETGERAVGFHSCSSDLGDFLIKNYSFTPVQIIV